MTSAIAAVRSDEIHARVKKLDELDPPPEQAQRLIDAVSDDDIDVNALARLIEAYPPVAARVVGLAGSAYFRRAKPVASVSDAIVRVLGLNLVKSIVMGIALSGSFSALRCSRFDAGRYWKSALMTATLSRQLARGGGRKRRVASDSAYLCGLLHNLGLLALIHVAPEPMDQVFAVAADGPGRGLREIEREFVFVDHAQAGASLAVKWSLPEEVAAVMGHAHDATYRGSHWPLTLLVGLSAAWVGHRLAQRADPPPGLEPLQEIGLAPEQVEETLEKFVAQQEEVEGLARVFTDSG